MSRTEPLPPNNYLDSETRQAYDQCLVLEKRTAWSIPQGQFATTPCLAARVLGYALLFAPCNSGRNRLISEILECRNDLALKNLADLYIDGLIRVFKCPKHQMPAVSSEHSPLLSLERALPNMRRLLEKPFITCRQLRTLVMFRDEHRCVFTGALDFAQYESDPTFSEESTDMLQLAHIISQSVPDNVRGELETGDVEKANWPSTMGGLVELFGGFSLRGILGESVQSPLNAFMASAQTYSMFNSLKLWLVPAQGEDRRVLPDTYDVKSTVIPRHFHRVGRGLKSRITLKARKVGDKIIPPPDPRVLAVHAACAQIANMSGAAEYLNESFQETGEISVMTQPGAVYELTRALRRVKTSTAV